MSRNRNLHKWANVKSMRTYQFSDGNKIQKKNLHCNFWASHITVVYKTHITGNRLQLKSKMLDVVKETERAIITLSAQETPSKGCVKAARHWLLTAGNVVSIGSQTNKVLFIDVTLEGAQTVGLVDIPQLQLTVCWPENQQWKCVICKKDWGCLPRGLVKSALNSRVMHPERHLAKYIFSSYIIHLQLNVVEYTALCSH